MSSPTAETVRLLMVVEGIHDIDFLRRISAILHAYDPELPSLAELERQGRVIMIPIGGGNLELWAHRLAGLGKIEFHLYDREVSPMSDKRQQLVAAISRRAGCIAMLTGKRAIENYLHRDAISETGGEDLEIDDWSDIPGLLVRKMLARRGGLDWDGLPPRRRKRLRDQAKRWLNTKAVERMTPERLTDRDPEGDVSGWMQIISRLVMDRDRGERR